MTLGTFEEFRRSLRQIEQESNKEVAKEQMGDPL
jgi:hypothetical protein